jgi:opacity protein-like surface antigen
MKLLLCALSSALLLSACAGNHYTYVSESNPMQWKGQNISAVEAKWGMADQILKTRTGSAYYVYTTKSVSSYFNSSVTNYSPGANAGGFGNAELTGYNDMTLACTTLFKTDATGVITDVTHKGNNCGGEWVAKPKVKVQ